MASSLTLDRSDPGVDELVSQWKDGGTYTVELTITQTKSSPNTAIYDVTGITDMGAPEDEAPAKEPAAKPAAKAKPELSVKY